MSENTVPTIAIILPMKDEERIAEKSIRQILEIIRNIPNECNIICVDDGSSDATWSIISKIAIEEKEVVAVKLSRNFGHDAALFAAMNITDTDAVITMDADGQHPFAAIPEIISLWQNSQANIVNCTKRVRADANVRYTLYAKLYSHILTKSLNMDMTNATEFKLLDRKAINALLACNDSHIFYRALAPWIGFKSVSYQFDVLPSLRGHTTWTVPKLIRFAIDGLVNFSDLPLRFLIYTGIAALLISATIMLKLLISLIFSDVPQGYTTLLAVSLLNLGLVMTGIGIVGIYTRATLVQSLNRPRWIIESIEK